MMTQTTTIRVEWNSRIGGGFTALAAEDKGGYKKGEEVAKVPFQMRRFPVELGILIKKPNDSI